MNGADQRRANQQQHADRLAEMYERTAQRADEKGDDAATHGDWWRQVAQKLRDGRVITWENAVADGRFNRENAVADGRVNRVKVWKNEPVRDQCPTCDTSGPRVYVADQHSLGTSCAWMMANLHRCVEHDELLLPTEDSCPAPDVPDHWSDPHNRFTER